MQHLRFKSKLLALRPCKWHGYFNEWSSRISKLVYVLGTFEKSSSCTSFSIPKFKMPKVHLAGEQWSHFTVHPAPKSQIRAIDLLFSFWHCKVCLRLIALGHFFSKDKAHAKTAF